ncbi:HlyD family efflux transporter periplasmic adaptor subunit [Actinospica sp. MGRD01-02]|uniref:HlyD family efflux transporter periplasmic adaptor subunit n=1 Tax=Actinospica acidithermotolerans TaxID=2828514 RepID=A0A941EIR0_9ACTN|nr:HlyD family efflux transporter periplasmic adaptor subunit [Actinospica acidithermotolerans]MBR7831153.1 HlyD family efflux transporter periplasmic adaptor subunit [Actinospica acidithermotolerans]
MRIRSLSRHAGIALTGVLALAGVGLAGCGGGGSTGIATASVGYSTVSQVVQASANIVPKAQVGLTATSSGTVATLAVQDGQHVTAGQVLGVISSPSAQQQLAEAKKALDQAPSAGSGVTDTAAGFTEAAAADQNSANTAFAKAQQAAEKVKDASLRSALLAEIKAAKSAYSSAMDSVNAAVSAFQQGLGSASQVLDALGQTTRTQDQAAVDTAQATVNALTITAPISGTVALGNGQSSGSGVSGSEISQLLAAAEGSGSSSGLSGSSSGSLTSLGSGSGSGSSTSATMISVGAPVDSGGTMFTVTDASALSVAAQVDETDVLDVHPGVKATIQLNAVPGATYQGTVTSVDPTATTSSQGSVTYTVRLSLGAGRTQDGSAAPTPLPGMSAIADLDVLTAKHALSVPSSALVINGQTTSVWVLTNGAAHLKRITLGAQGDTQVQVLAGLSAGQRIVVSGADKVTDGEQVG